MARNSGGIALFFLVLICVGRAHDISLVAKETLGLRKMVTERIASLPRRGLFDGRGLADRIQHENAIEADVKKYEESRALVTRDDDSSDDSDKQMIFLEIEQRSKFVITAIVLLCVTAVLLVGAAVYSWKRYKVWKEHMKSMHQLRMSVRQEKFEMCQYIQSMRTRYTVLRGLHQAQLSSIQNQIAKNDDINPIKFKPEGINRTVDHILRGCKIGTDAPIRSDGGQSHLKNRVKCMLDGVTYQARRNYKTDEIKATKLAKTLAGALITNRVAAMFENSASIPEIFGNFISSQCEGGQSDVFGGSAEEVFRLAKAKSARASKDLIMSLVSIAALGVTAGWSPSIGISHVGESTARTLDLVFEGAFGIVKYSDPHNRVFNAVNLISTGLTIAHLVLTIIGSAVTPFISAALAALTLYKAVTAYYKDVEIARWQLNYTKHVYKEERYDFAFLFCRTLARVKTLEKEQKRMVNQLRTNYLESASVDDLQAMVTNTCTLENAAICYQQMLNPNYQKLFGPPAMWLSYAARHGPITDIALSWNTRMDAVLIANGYTRLPQNIQAGDTSKMPIYTWIRRSYGRSYISEVIGCDSQECKNEKLKEGYILLDLNLTNDPNAKSISYMMYKRTSNEDDALYDLQVIATKGSPKSSRHCQSQPRRGFHKYCYFKHVLQINWVTELGSSSYFDFTRGEGSYRMYVGYKKKDRSIISLKEIQKFLNTMEDESVAFIGADVTDLNNKFGAKMRVGNFDVGPITSIQYVSDMNTLTMDRIRRLEEDNYRPIDYSMRWWVSRNSRVSQALDSRCRSNCAIQEMYTFVAGTRIPRGFECVQDMSKSRGCATWNGRKNAYHVIYKNRVSPSKPGMWLSDLKFAVHDDNVITSMSGRNYINIIEPHKTRGSWRIINENTLNLVGEADNYSEMGGNTRYGMWALFNMQTPKWKGIEGHADEMVNKVTKDANVGGRLCANGDEVPETAQCIFVDDRLTDSYDPPGILNYNPVTNMDVLMFTDSSELRGRSRKISHIDTHVTRAWKVSAVKSFVSSSQMDLETMMKIYSKDSIEERLTNHVRSSLLENESNFITGIAVNDNISYNWMSHSSSRRPTYLLKADEDGPINGLKMQFAMGRPIVEIDADYTEGSGEFLFTTENPTVKESLSKAFKLKRKYQKDNFVLYSQAIQTKVGASDDEDAPWAFVTVRVKKTRRLPFLRREMCLDEE